MKRVSLVVVLLVGCAVFVLGPRASADAELCTGDSGERTCSPTGLPPDTVDAVGTGLATACYPFFLLVPDPPGTAVCREDYGGSRGSQTTILETGSVTVVDTSGPESCNYREITVDVGSSTISLFRPPTTSC